MVCTGEGGDVADFANWAAANLRLYKTRNGWAFVLKKMKNAIIFNKFLTKKHTK
jgi:hypothetical protein